MANHRLIVTSWGTRRALEEEYPTSCYSQKAFLTNFHPAGRFSKKKHWLGKFKEYFNLKPKIKYGPQNRKYCCIHMEYYITTTTQRHGLPINYVSVYNMQIWLLKKVFLFSFQLVKGREQLSWLVKKKRTPFSKSEIIKCSFLWYLYNISLSQYK